MKVVVYGTGCAKCKELELRTKAALGNLSLDCEVEKVTELNKIIEAGVMMTPALGIDGQIVLTGRLPSIPELTKIIDSGAERSEGSKK